METLPYPKCLELSFFRGTQETISPKKKHTLEKRLKIGFETTETDTCFLRALTSISPSLPTAGHHLQHHCFCELVLNLHSPLVDAVDEKR